MKKLISLLLILVCLLSLAACKGTDSGASAKPSQSGGGTDKPVQAETKAKDPDPVRTQSDKVPTVLSQTEYVLYQNIFFNKLADDFLGKKAVKEGTFVRLEDRFNNVTRYYVWGYYDNTKCCDWQWEFVPKDPDSLPANGSMVKMTGTLTRDEAALDKLWFTDAEVELEILYNGPTADADLCAMSATLERVQLINMQRYAADFEGKSVRLYGRVLDTASIQHPYYDSVWKQGFETSDQVPAIGTEVIVSGTWTGGSITEAGVKETKDY